MLHLLEVFLKIYFGVYWPMATVGFFALWAWSERQDRRRAVRV